ncbi:unnamed protein product [marine sediment metagenome]|uniref:Uncharacterized protein n=1 Tax=marine sediment metagenome TaxID=412755 RepID=X0UFJ8_9ZZZZ
MFKIVASLTGGLAFVAVLLFVATTCVDVANSAEPEFTEQELIEFRIQFCQDSVYHHYLSRTGIQLNFDVTNYVDDATPIVGVASSDDERFSGQLHFRCVYGEVEGVDVLTAIEIEVTQ